MRTRRSYAALALVVIALSSGACGSDEHLPVLEPEQIERALRDEGLAVEQACFDVGNLAQVMLGFLESLSHIDDNALEIVEAHHKTLNAIIAKQMKGDGGKYGQELQEELTHACERYKRTNGNL